MVGTGADVETTRFGFGRDNEDGAEAEGAGAHGAPIGIAELGAGE